MFHTYVLAASGTRVDIDLAWHVMMSGELFHAAVVAAKREREASSGWDANRSVQRVWDHYCALHLEKCGTPFEPDVNPDWEPPRLLEHESVLGYIENPPDDPPPKSRVERVTAEDRRRFAEESLRLHERYPIAYRAMLRRMNREY
jgi:hypothetical protein